MSAADDATPVTAAEAAELFAPLREAPALLLAVSGGPDSTALLLLASRWRRALKQGPALLAVTVDHGLRPESRAEADAVKRLARQCGVAHRTVRWTGCKPRSGLQQAAREARYSLLAEAAEKFGARHVLTGHTSDDQAETVLIRMSRGSGIAGLGGMTAMSPLPVGEERAITVVRPFLDLPKARLIATLAEAGLAFADDPSNCDPRFTRARLRALMPALAREGLDRTRLTRLSLRLRRAEAALETAADTAWADLAQERPGGVAFAPGFADLPAEIQLRLLGRAIAQYGDEGPVELGKLEVLYAALAARSTGTRLRRTLAGAMVTRERDRLTVEKAPERRPVRTRNRGRQALNHGTTSPPQSGQTAVE